MNGEVLPEWQAERIANMTGMLEQLLSHLAPQRTKQEVLQASRVLSGLVCMALLYSVLMINFLPQSQLTAKADRQFAVELYCQLVNVLHRKRKSMPHKQTSLLGKRRFLPYFITRFSAHSTTTFSKMSCCYLLLSQALMRFPYQ